MITNIYVETPLRRIKVVRFNTEHPKKLLKLIHTDNILIGGIMVYEDGTTEFLKWDNKEMNNPDLFRYFAIVLNRHKVSEGKLVDKETLLENVGRWMQEILNPCTSPK